MGTDFDIDELDSVFSTPSSPMGQKRKHPFDSQLKDEVWELAPNFAETSPLLRGIRKTGVAKERITVLTLEAVMQHSKSVAGAKSTIKNVAGLVRFFRDFRSEENATLTGEASLVLLRDYLEQAASRGRTVPAATRHSLVNWAAALQIDWPLGHALISSAPTIESNTAPKQAPSMAIETAKLLEGVSANPDVAPFKRQFAAGILLMSYDSIRFFVAQRLKTFEVKSDSIRGALIACKTRKQHGIDWPWACSLMGITGAAKLSQPILDFRAAQERVSGSPPCFAFPRINRFWQLESADAAPTQPLVGSYPYFAQATGARRGNRINYIPPDNLPTRWETR